MPTLTGKPWIDNAYPIWVCQCCMLTHANGECCSDDAHGGDGREPLSALSPDDGLAMGMGWEDHNAECERYKTQGNPPGDYECDCETRTFDTSSCDGCGSYLAGERHAMAVFPGERVSREDSKA